MVRVMSLVLQQRINHQLINKMNRYLKVGNLSGMDHQAKSLVISLSKICQWLTSKISPKKTDLVLDPKVKQAASMAVSSSKTAANLVQTGKSSQLRRSRKRSSARWQEMRLTNNFQISKRYILNLGKRVQRHLFQLCNKRLLPYLETCMRTTGKMASFTLTLR